MAGSTGVEHAVLVHVALSSDWGSAKDRLRQWRLQRRLEQAVGRAGVGECDATLVGDGEVVFSVYGPDVRRLWQAVEPVLRSMRVGPGHAVLRAGDATVAPQRVEL